MLTVLDERWKAGLFPPGVWFHLIHLGPEFRVLCFLMSVPNRVWGSMGLPCITCLASYNSVVARADLYLQCVCAGGTPVVYKPPWARRTCSLAGPPCPAEDPVSCEINRLYKPATDGRDRFESVASF